MQFHRAAACDSLSLLWSKLLSFAVASASQQFWIQSLFCGLKCETGSGFNRIGSMQPLPA